LSRFTTKILSYEKNGTKSEIMSIFTASDKVISSQEMFGGITLLSCISPTYIYPTSIIDLKKIN
jgi:hypothetical protein